ncbi:MAG: hypothetical protein IKP47_04690 [Ruminococcus sp.]|nr:hypothetical protein [Ruminococcus sp.]
MQLRKTAAALAALIMLGSMAGCSEADSSSKAEESSAPAATSTVTEKENKETLPAADAGNAAQIEELTKKVEELSAEVSKLKSKMSEYGDYGIHEVYDDTAVVEAFKKKDPSGLTDEKDKVIYEGLVKGCNEIIKDGMTDFEQEKAVYDYIFSNTHIDYRHLNPLDDDESDVDDSYTPYGFFKSHNSVCLGYSTTFKLFMDVLGIECKIIHSTEQGEHGWNVVKIGGDWYHVDIYFDGGQTSPLYGRFNVTDEIKKYFETYPWDETEYPACTSLKYNILCMNAEECGIYDIPAKLAEAAKSESRIATLRIKVPEEATLEGFSDQILMLTESLTQDVYSISSQLISDSENNSVVLSVHLADYEDYDDDDDWYDDYDDDRRYADIDYSKLRNGFTKAFNGALELSDDLSDDYFDMEPQGGVC